MPRQKHAKRTSVKDLRLILQLTHEQGKCGWFGALTITPIIISAGIALLSGDGCDSPVAVQVVK